MDSPIRRNVGFSFGCHENAIEIAMKNAIEAGSSLRKGDNVSLEMKKIEIPTAKIMAHSSRLPWNTTLELSWVVAE